MRCFAPHFFVACHVSIKFLIFYESYFHSYFEVIILIKELFLEVGFMIQELKRMVGADETI